MYFFTRSKYIKMMLNEPNIQLNELNRIKIPVVVLAGEKAGSKLQKAIELGVKIIDENEFIKLTKKGED